MLTILHASDLQSGRPYRPTAAAALLALAHELGPDAVVVSGDLTQRARVREYLVVRELLASLPPVPVILTPGNHDVPLFRSWERVFSPYRNWRRFVSHELDTVTSIPGATFVALNSSTPLRAIVNGHVDPDQLAFARRAFREAPPGNRRVLVVHHHFVRVPGNIGGPPLPRARVLLEAVERMDVDVVLGGHVHQTRLTWSREPEADGERPPVPLVSSGTTTSSRGRGVELGRNSLNVVRLEDGGVEVTPYLLEDGAERFEAREPVRFARPRDGVPIRAAPTEEAG